MNFFPEIHNLVINAMYGSPNHVYFVFGTKKKEKPNSLTTLDPKKQSSSVVNEKSSKKMNRKNRSNPYEMLREINRENTKGDIFTFRKETVGKQNMRGSNEMEKKGEIGVVGVTETQKKGLGDNQSQFSR